MYGQRITDNYTRGWNITRSAKLLGLSFRTMQYRLDKFGIKRPNRGKDLEEEETE